jgi:prepilin-type N-terminal cleavage/methylation domain-containing protein
MRIFHQTFRSKVTREDAFTLIELLVVIAVIGIFVALLMPVISRSKARARNIICVSQLRQLGIATRLYAEDNDSRLPIAERLPSLPIFPDRTLPRICDLLGPYAGGSKSTNINVRIFKCPSDTGQFFEVEGSSYMWNAGLNGTSIDFGQRIRYSGGGVLPNSAPTWRETNVMFSVSSTPLLLDYDEFHLGPSKSGRNIVFMDNHVAPMKNIPINNQTNQ